MKTSLKTMLFASVLVAGTAMAVGLLPHTTKPQPIPTPVQLPTVAKPKIEVVFVLDTTGSMSGLIDAAKNNIWSIASTMASAQPAPEMHLGLVAFRDRGDAYVTQVFDLSRDLDSMYAALMDFRADGGGDGPESVNQALHEAVTRMSWSQDTNSYKVIFLVGDAPPHMDYPDDVKYPDTLKLATAKGIVVNTIQAGEQADTRTTWQHIASLNQGRFLQVEQSGSAVAVATPFDDKLAQLARELDETRLFYGDADKRAQLRKKEQAAEKVHAASPAAVQAKRAEFNASGAGASNFLADSELVDAVSSGKVSLESLRKEELPAPLQTLKPSEQKAVIAEKAQQRAALKEEIARLGAQRQQYIKDRISANAVAESLDGQLYETVRTQAKAKGLAYDRAPSL
jgi:Mg-chelatase subunit ChlD